MKAILPLPRFRTSIASAAKIDATGVWRRRGDAADIALHFGAALEAVDEIIELPIEPRGDVWPTGAEINK